MIINGKPTTGHVMEAIPVINPANGEMFEQVPRGTANEI
jgi:acyl-CoA reductase-like NAD-dependent aldehyde dehydrogenase